MNSGKPLTDNADDNPEPISTFTKAKYRAGATTIPKGSRLQVKPKRRVSKIEIIGGQRVAPVD